MFQAREVHSPDEVRLIIREHAGFITGEDRKLQNKPTINELWGDQIIELTPYGVVIFIAYVVSLLLLNADLLSTVPFALALGITFVVVAGFWFARGFQRRIDALEKHGKVIRAQIQDAKPIRALDSHGLRSMIEVQYTFYTIDGQTFGSQRFSPDVLPPDQVPADGTRVAVLYINARDNWLL